MCSKCVCQWWRWLYALTFQNPQCVGHFFVIEKSINIHSAAIGPTVYWLDFLNTKVHLARENITNKSVPVRDFWNNSIVICLHKNVVTPEGSTVSAPADMAETVTPHWIMAGKDYRAPLCHFKRLVWWFGPCLRESIELMNFNFPNVFISVWSVKIIFIFIFRSGRNTKAEVLKIGNKRLSQHSLYGNIDVLLAWDY